MMNLEDVDTIFVPFDLINEYEDKRNEPGTGNITREYIRDYVDWRVWSDTGFGHRVQRDLAGMGVLASVSDFGDTVSITATIHNIATGRSTSKTFVAVFGNIKNQDGRLMASSTKWRTFSNVSQISSYIYSSLQSAKSSINNS